MPRILVLDCDRKNSLAIIRHLGQKDRYRIDATSHAKHSLAMFSKYIHQKFVVSDPKKNPEKYIDDLIQILSQHQYLAIIPVSYISFQLCSQHKERISKYTSLTIAPPAQIDIASSKIKTYRLAEKLGIPYPKMITLNSVDEIKTLETTYPCVVKAPFEVGKNLVEYAQNKEELVRKYTQMCQENQFEGALPIVQKFIVGEGAGFFAFYQNGECKNYFMHKRIREYPVKGGASVVAEAFYDEQVLKHGKLILDELKWEGVAMVEFKKDNQTGEFNLMEINAKFWGSLDLALVSGVDFPQMLIDVAEGKEIEKVTYTHEKFQWILNGDLFHILEKPSHVFGFFGTLFTAKNDFWLRDIKPNLFQVVYIPMHFYKKWFK